MEQKARLTGWAGMPKNKTEGWQEEAEKDCAKTNYEG
jgi:hypothetical protein